MDCVEKLRLGIMSACLVGAWLGVMGSAQAAELPRPRLESETPQPGDPSLVLLGLKPVSGGESGPVHLLSMLVQNTTSQPFDTIEIQILLRARDGRVRSARLFPLVVTLAPGESRVFAKEIHGFSLQAGDALVLGTSLAPSPSLVDNPSARIDAELQHLEQLAGPPGETMRGVLDELRALEETSAASGEDDLVLLPECLIFCLRCAQTAAILCTDGVDSITCNCSEGLCAIDCK